MAQGNGGIIGTLNTPTANAAGGVWTMRDMELAQKNGTWPQTQYQYQIARSLRFNSADSAYLNRTPASATNQKTWTWSGWVKRSALSSNQTFFNAGGNGFVVRFNNPTDFLEIYNYSGGYQLQVITSQVFRDASAWYHIVIALDTTQATNTNRIKLYVNGSQVTAFGTATYPSQNADLLVNGANLHAIGVLNTIGQYYDGLITDVRFIDGQALTPSSFGEYNADTGVWQGKTYAGTYGTNGFWLKFADNSGTTAATLGADSSGNGNNFTPNNFSVTAGAGNDSLVDSPTSYGTDTGVGGTVRGNYCTLNPLNVSASMSLSDGNLKAQSTANFFAIAHATMGIPSSGKWYWEYTMYPNSVVNAGVGCMIGIAPVTAIPTKDTYLGNSSNGYALWTPDGSGSNSAAKRFNSSNTTLGSAFAMQNGDVIQVAFDAGNGQIWFGRNNTWFEGSPSSGTSPSFTSIATSTTWVPAVQPYYDASYTNNYAYLNFGQRPFAYTAPSGYKALCTQNLPTPTIGATAATQAGKFFNTVLYQGTELARSFTGVGFAPDMLWQKVRTLSYYNWFQSDRVRGANVVLNSDASTGEQSNKGPTSFDSDGWSVSAGPERANENGQTFVTYAWKANGSGSTNTAGSITSTVSANTTSGFSIVTYTGTSAVNTIGHGLGVAPSMIIVKSRSGSPTVPSWRVYHVSLGPTKYIELNVTDAAGTFSDWNNTSPTSTVFSVGASSYNPNNQSGINYVAYCFAEVAGYSKFGSYTGNGSADGTFIYMGFRPAYVLIKRTDTGGYDWWIMDATRSPANAVRARLYANTTDAEVANDDRIDFVSNGIKLRNAELGFNANGGTYIYACFATNPFKYSLAR